MKISVFGMGYVGLVSAACLAKYGHNVTGVDIAPGKVDLIRSGRSPIVEAGLDELVAEMTSAGRLSATTDAIAALRETDISLVSVGTPSQRNGAADLGALDKVIEQIGATLRGKATPHTVVVRSTVPPGTIDERLGPALSRAVGRNLGDGIDLCSNPEFLREGSAIRDFAEPPFTLIGCTTDRGFDVIAGMYAEVKGKVVRTDIRTAEATKYLCNIFHATKIGFANELGSLLKTLGIDSRQAMRILCEDKALNISPAYLRPGFAFGGSCLPKDIRAFSALARKYDMHLPIVEALLSSNDQHIERAFDLIANSGRRKVALFGLSFKQGTDDLRESPLVVLAERLLGKGFELAIFDRHVDIARLVGANRDYINREIPHLERLLQSTPEVTLAGAEIIVIGHVAASELDAIKTHYVGGRIIDLQGVAELEDLENADYQGICW